MTITFEDVCREIDRCSSLLSAAKPDTPIDAPSLAALTGWLGTYSELSSFLLLKELRERLEDMADEKIIASSELSELESFCEHASDPNGPLDRMQRELATIRTFVETTGDNRALDVMEIAALRRWIQYHRGHEEALPYSRLAPEVREIVCAGALPSHLKSRILDMVEELDLPPTGRDRPPPYPNLVDEWLRSNDPRQKTVDQLIEWLPPVEVKEKSFCLAGRMRRHSHRVVEPVITQAGGIIHPTVLPATDYVVVGTLSNPAWIYATYGSKIEATFRGDRAPRTTRIIHEDHLMEALRR